MPITAFGEDLRRRTLDSLTAGCLQKTYERSRWHQKCQLLNLSIPEGGE
jgi:hypothetical protein